MPDRDLVAAVIRSVAVDEILPRFRHLTASDVSHKRSPSDLVTTADTMAERRLAERLPALAPGSRVLGEEAADGDPSVLRALAEPAPVWVVDPVDGTFNFAHGDTCFAVLVALCVDGETMAGWIHDPVRDRMAWAVPGGGAWLAETGQPWHRLHVAKGKPVDQMVGRVGARLAERVAAQAAAGQGTAPRKVVRYKCTGQEYLDMARGHLDFARYTRLKPWDHAAGVLIHGEAGGVARMTGDEAPYRVVPGIDEGTILMAPDLASWRELNALFG